MKIIQVEDGDGTQQATLVTSERMFVKVIFFFHKIYNRIPRKAILTLRLGCTDPKNMMKRGWKKDFSRNSEIYLHNQHWLNDYKHWYAAMSKQLGYAAMFFFIEQQVQNLLLAQFLVWIRENI
jgi:hypothetical protein